jgi:hypothetical protein
MIRLKTYRWTDMDVGSYRRILDVQMTSTVVECLQGIDTAKEAVVQCKDGLASPAIEYEHFTRANNTYMKHNMYSNALQSQYYEV